MKCSMNKILNLNNSIALFAVLMFCMSTINYFISTLADPALFAKSSIYLFIVSTIGYCIYLLISALPYFLIIRSSSKKYKYFNILLAITLIKSINVIMLLLDKIVPILIRYENLTFSKLSILYFIDYTVVPRYALNALILLDAFEVIQILFIYIVVRIATSYNNINIIIYIIFIEYLLRSMAAIAA